MASALISPHTRALLAVDSTGPFATLVARRPDGACIALNGRRDPVGEADRWLTQVLRGDDPPVIVLIGLGLGYVLDALERRGSRAAVLAFEPFADGLPHFFARRDWSPWLDTGRLQIVPGPNYAEGSVAWRAIDPAEIPPVLVAPALSAEFSATVAGCRVALTRARRGTRFDLFRAVVKQSMLHPDVLTTLEHFAARANGAIVEIGAYVGGATMAMASGVRDSGRNTPIITIEPGGTYPTHPELPSGDILGDLQRNLESRRLDRFVTVHRGLSSDPAALDLVRATLAAADARIGLLCIDADGSVQRDFDLYLPMCASGCLISVDDYATSESHGKAGTTQEAVHQLIASGKAHQLGVYGFGTWMGIYHP